MKINLRRMIVFAVCVCLFASDRGMAFAQSDADVRRENQRLRTENQDLHSELEAARQRIVALERELARLARALEAAGRSEVVDETFVPDEREPGSVDETDPAGSPRGLLNALKASYEETMAGLPRGRVGDRDRGLYMRALRQWVNRVNREFRAPIEWHVQVLEAAPVSAGYLMRFVAIDPKNQERLGEPFEAQVPRAQARRYEVLAARDEVGLFVFRASLTPTVRINEERTIPGPFNNPPLIGPFAEFGFTVESRSLVPAEEAKEEADQADTR